MITCKRIQTALTLLACIVPSTRIAAELAPSTHTRANEAVDIELDAGGLLTGKIVDQAGQAVPNATLVLKTGQHPFVETLADANGEFRIKSLQGGVYQLTADGFTSTARLWTAQTGPPHAKKVATLVTGTIVRGQSCTNDSCTGTCHECGGFGIAGGSAPLAFLLNPIVIGAAVTAAVAIPIAIEDNNDDTINAPASP